MEKIEVDDVVQLDPENCKNPMLGGCMLTVTEVKALGGSGLRAMPWRKRRDRRAGLLSRALGGI